MSSHLSRAARAGIALSVLLLVPFAVGSGTAADIQPGTLTAAHFRSAVLGEDISYNVYLPAGYASTAKHYPVLYLLHGRGDSMSAWTQVKGKLDADDRRRRDPADDRDHARRSLEQPRELLRRLARYRRRRSRPPGRDGVHERPDPARRLDLPHARRRATGASIGGYSMGGYGAMRYSIAHPDLFAASIVLSPAVYFPKPPNDSSTREFGAFGQGQRPLRRLNLPQAQLPRRAAAVQRERACSRTCSSRSATTSTRTRIRRTTTHDLDFEAHILYKRAERAPNLSSELRVAERRARLGRLGARRSRRARSTRSSSSPGPRSTIMKATLVGDAGRGPRGRRRRPTPRATSTKRSRPKGRSTASRTRAPRTSC